MVYSRWRGRTGNVARCKRDCGKPPVPRGPQDHRLSRQTDYASRACDVNLPRAACRRALTLVMYWVHVAGAMLAAGPGLERVGLVTTNSIRGGQNREVLKGALEFAEIFEAWSDQEWTLDGADVRVSIVCLRPREAVGEEVVLFSTDARSRASMPT